jgi:hypothetical protein
MGLNPYKRKFGQTHIEIQTFKDRNKTVSISQGEISQKK